MIVFVSTLYHRYTHKSVAKAVPEFRRMPYGWLLSRRRLPHATYIFTDFDRLGYWDLEHASRIYRVGGVSPMRNALRLAKCP